MRGVAGTCTCCNTLAMESWARVQKLKLQKVPLSPKEFTVCSFWEHLQMKIGVQECKLNFRPAYLLIEYSNQQTNYTISPKNCGCHNHAILLKDLLEKSWMGKNPLWVETFFDLCKTLCSMCTLDCTQQWQVPVPCLKIPQ